VQAHYTDVLMRDMAKVPLPAERIHSTTLSAEPKASVLARLAAEHPGAERYIFVEDKFSTLEKVSAELLLLTHQTPRTYKTRVTERRGDG
jgi:hypothetical protein